MMLGVKGEVSKNNTSIRNIYIAIGFIILVFTMLFALFSGDTKITPAMFLQALLSGEDHDSANIIIIMLRIRIPRILLAAIAGGSLGISGALMQSILGNSLASPYTLGVSSASGFGASLAIVAGHSFLSGEFAIITNAFLFAIAACLAVYALASIFGSSPLIIILAGMGINFLFSSLTTLIHYFATPEAVYRAIFWTAGSLSNASWNIIGILFLVLTSSLIMIYPILYDLSLVTTGDKNALIVGVDVRKIRLVGLILASLLAASSISFIGVIGFVGLVSPHFCRLVGMEDPRGLIPLSGVTGGILLVLSDIVATRIAAPIILPIGAITSVIGVIFLFGLVVVRGRRIWIQD